MSRELYQLSYGPTRSITFHSTNDLNLCQAPFAWLAILASTTVAQTRLTTPFVHQGPGMLTLFG